jgi:hypothetical protein
VGQADQRLGLGHEQVDERALRRQRRVDLLDDQGLLEPARTVQLGEKDLGHASDREPLDQVVLAERRRQLEHAARVYHAHVRALALGCLALVACGDDGPRLHLAPVHSPACGAVAGARTLLVTPLGDFVGERLSVPLDGPFTLPTLPADTRGLRGRGDRRQRRGQLAIGRTAPLALGELGRRRRRSAIAMAPPDGRVSGRRADRGARSAAGGPGRRRRAGGRRRGRPPAPSATIRRPRPPRRCRCRPPSPGRSASSAPA